MPSEDLEGESVYIRGLDFNQECTLDTLMTSMISTGLQASALGQAINEVNRMVSEYVTIIIVLWVKAGLVLYSLSKTPLWS